MSLKEFNIKDLNSIYMYICQKFSSRIKVLYIKESDVARIFLSLFLYIYVK